MTVRTGGRLCHKRYVIWLLPTNFPCNKLGAPRRFLQMAQLEKEGKEGDGKNWRPFGTRAGEQVTLSPFLSFSCVSRVCFHRPR